MICYELHTAYKLCRFDFQSIYPSVFHCFNHHSIVETNSHNSIDITTFKKKSFLLKLIVHIPSSTILAAMTVKTLFFLIYTMRFIIFVFIVFIAKWILIVFVLKLDVY